MHRTSHTWLLLLGLVGCSDAKETPKPDETDTDSGTTPPPVVVDAGETPDAGEPDTAYRDAIVASKWTALPNAPTVNGKQDDLYFRTKSYGLSVNGEGRIFRTEDGGDTWAKLIEQPGTFFRSIVMLDDAHGFAGNIGPGVFPGVTDEKPLYETKDRGDTWSVVTNVTGPAPTGICNMHKLDDQHVYAVGRVGGPAFFLASADAGASWTSKDVSSDLDMLIDVRMTSTNDGLIVGRKDDKCTVLRTADGGGSWTPVFTSAIDGTLCWKMSFPSDSVGYVSIQGGSKSTFAKTRDGGATWEEKPLSKKAFRGLGAGFITEEIGWMADDKGALRTTDGGETWEKDESLGPAVNRFRFVDKYTGYAIGTTIYKLTVPAP